MSVAPIHVGIVGGGIVGICSALALQEAGQTATLIERDRAGQATSSGNAGVISPWSIVPQAMPGIWKSIPGMVLRPDGPAAVSLRHGPRYLPWLMRFLRQATPERARANSEAMHHLCGESVTLYRQLLEGTGHEDLIADSMYVHAFRDPAKADTGALGYRLRQARGARMRRIGAQDLRALEPALSDDFQAAILIEGQARACNPARLCTVLADMFQRRGGTILRGEVRGLRPDAGGWQVTLTDTRPRFDKIVVAAGAWSSRLLGALGVRVPLAHERGYHVSFGDPGLHLNNSVMDAEAHAVASSMEGGLRVAGTAEFADIDTPANTARIKAVARVARAMLPDLGGRPFDTWMGVRPSFPDSLPLIEEVPGHPGLIAAFGHSHYGLMMAPKTGKLVAGIATGSLSNIHLSPFASARFARHRSGEPAL